MHQLKNSKGYKLKALSLLSLFLIVGCATPSVVYKTRYVPVDNPRPVCVYVIEDTFKEKVYLSVNDLPNVQSDDDVELLAKAALDDIQALDDANDKLVGEVERVEKLCDDGHKQILLERQETLESINELNESES